eukprot:3325806-Pleurochrysis_carterae.AAC.2
MSPVPVVAEACALRDALRYGDGGTEAAAAGAHKGGPNAVRSAQHAWPLWESACAGLLATVAAAGACCAARLTCMRTGLCGVAVAGREVRAGLCGTDAAEVRGRGDGSACASLVGEKGPLHSASNHARSSGSSAVGNGAKGRSFCKTVRIGQRIVDSRECVDVRVCECRSVWVSE